MKKTYKKLAIALLTVAVVANVQARRSNDDNDRSGLYQPKTPWPLAPVEDAVVGAGSTTAEIVTLGHADTGNAPTGLVVAAPDAIPGVSYARKKDSDKKSCNKQSSKKGSSCTKKCKMKNNKCTNKKHHVAGMSDSDSE